jgi:hypothetical protein
MRHLLRFLKQLGMCFYFCKHLKNANHHKKMYCVRAYDADAKTNVLISHFSQLTSCVWVAPWPKSCRQKPGVQFIIYPGVTSDRFLKMQKDEVMCVYYKTILMTWTRYHHVVYPSFESPEKFRSRDVSPPHSRRFVLRDVSSALAPTNTSMGDTNTSMVNTSDDDDERLWIVRGESKEHCKDALIMAQNLFCK